LGEVPAVVMVTAVKEGQLNC